MRISDWSSYVCSSDLDRDQAHRSTFKIDALILGHVLHIVQRIFDEARNSAMIARRADDDPIGTAQGIAQRSRSEERRVGKAGVCRCRSRWSIDYKNTQKKINENYQKNLHKNIK